MNPPTVAVHAFVADRWLRCATCGCPKSVLFHYQACHQVHDESERKVM